MATPIEPIEENLRQNFEELFNRLNVLPDDNGKAGNLEWEVIEETMAADTSHVIYHKLGRVPQGFIPYRQDAYGSIIVEARTETTITIKAENAMTVKGFVI